MNIHLDPSSELQLYKQLANQLIEFIAKEELKNGFDDLHTNETAAVDDRYWKWGIVYTNKNDLSLLLQKKYFVGWTVNLANI